MKKRVYYILLLTAFTSLFCACEDDTIDNTITPEEAAPFVGVYKGKMTPNVDGVDVREMWQQVKVTNENGILQMRMEAFRVNDIEFGNITLENIEGSQENGETMEFTAKANQSLNNISNANILAKGNINGKTMTIDFTIQSVSTPTVNASMVAEKRDRVENDTARILSMWFDDERIVMQPDVNEYSTTINFYVTDTLADSVQVVLYPKFELTPGSTVFPAAGDSVNFSNGRVKFTVWAEDSIHRTIYYVYSDKAQALRYDMELWQTWPKGETNNDLTYLTPQEEIWQTGNEALRYWKKQGVYGMQSPYSVEKETQFVNSGEAAVKISTRYVNGATPALQAGVFYTGEEFEVNPDEPLKSVRFGTVFETKPLKIKGSYSYTPGTQYYQNNVLAPEMADTCRISAILYEINDAYETLDSLDIYKDEKIVAIGTFESGATNATEYTPFEVHMSYIKSYFFTKKYKLAIIATPSRNGATFEGADGSTLWIDDIEIISQDKK